MRVGLVCPYAWDVPGGVQAHVRDLSLRLLALGHEVSVLAPVDETADADLPAHVVSAGRSVPVPYNGSVARLAFGPLSLARTLRWVRAGRFDVLHVHEPTVPSLSMLATFAAQGPLVATFHTATTRSRALQVFGTALQPGLEKVTGRIAVSPAARRVIVEHLGGDAVLVPNGVEVARFAGAEPLALADGRPTVVFLGRLDEPRKGLAVLLAALPALTARVPDVRVLVAGPGEAPPGLPPCVELLGRVAEADKPSLYATGDVYCAPNVFGESFGIVLAEALATGTPVVASDLEAFRAVLDDGRAGVLFPVGDAAALAALLVALLHDPDRRRALREAGHRTVAAFDWGVVTRSVVEVYETV
ncbi:MAG: Phosphatidylinositol alpha-mannosyltransferase, partial [Frankiales bacterium]|nr:Phosphatidylinositol alpha-mannosyltransferase [Frankiales bacterium]